MDRRVSVMFCLCNTDSWETRNNEVAIVVVNTELRHAPQNVAHMPRCSVPYTTIDTTDTNNQ